MKIGYACIALGIEDGGYKSCMLKNAAHERLARLTAQNIETLGRITEYNAACGIRLYRIGSGIIPFGSHPNVSFDWRRLFAERLDQAGEKIRAAGLRVSMHPGQYTVMNSPQPSVLANAVRDLHYHAAVLDALGCGSDCKIVLHVGGVYGDRRLAEERFMANMSRLPQNILSRIVLENDERCFHIAQVLELADRLGLPAVFDTLHNAVNPVPGAGLSDAQWVALCARTWHEADGVQKIHYSQQLASGRPGAHSETIDEKEFLRFYHSLGGRDVDVMLEVKDKDLSARRMIKAVMEK